MPLLSWFALWNFAKLPFYWDTCRSNCCGSLVKPLERFCESEHGSLFLPSNMSSRLSSHGHGTTVATVTGKKRGSRGVQRKLRIYMMTSIWRNLGLMRRSFVCVCVFVSSLLRAVSHFSHLSIFIQHSICGLMSCSA